MNYWTAAKMIGGGNVHRGMMTIRALALGCKMARKKHHVFAEGKYHALGVIGEEFRELEHAVLHESDERQKDEALDVIATCIRFLCDEHRQEERA
mgnify:FL=1